MPVLYRNRK